jgi:hypothetical protein
LLVQVPERGQERRLLGDLKPGLERAPLGRQERVLLQSLVQTQVQGLLRCEGRGLVMVQEQRLELALLRFDERRLVRGLVIGLER